jgi:hypothetical protein
MAIEFDPTKSFDEHIAEYRAHLESLDPDCAKILFDNLATLIGDGNPTRVRANRTAFNAAVLKELKALPPETAGS